MYLKDPEVLASPKRRRLIQSAATIAGVSTLGFPALSLAQNKPIRVGMPTILSGRVAMLGQSSSNAATMEVEKFNASGGFGGRKIELIIRGLQGSAARSSSGSA
jgi:branched-chain amino acid transport system substrate-binding protein